MRAGQLQTLAMNGNRIQRIAPQLGQCQTLRFLHLQANKIETIPEELTSLEVAIKLGNSYNLSDASKLLSLGLQAILVLSVFQVFTSRLARLVVSTFSAKLQKLDTSLQCSVPALLVICNLQIASLITLYVIFDSEGLSAVYWRPWWSSISRTTEFAICLEIGVSWLSARKLGFMAIWCSTSQQVSGGCPDWNVSIQ